MTPPVQTVAPTTEATATTEPTHIKPEGKDYVVDLTVKAFPAVLQGGRRFTSIAGNVFNLPERFSITSSLGKGAYCQVVAANDNTVGKEVAIRKCSYVFARNEDGKRLLREVKLLAGLQHQNILTFSDILVPLEDKFIDLYFITEKMDTDLYQYQAFKGLCELQVKPILYQVLCALKYIHSAHVMHRDLKPDNILLRNSDGCVKICDFNLSRGFEPNLAVSAEPMTSNIATRWYRSPEVLVGNLRYSSAVDVWSMGCILVEMLTGQTLFPGTTEADMFDRFFQTIPLPNDTKLEWIESPVWKTQLETIIESKRTLGIVPNLPSILPTSCSPEAKDLISRSLVLNPSERITVTEMLQHPYVSEYYSPGSCPPSEKVFKWKYDNLKPSDDILRGLFWREIERMHPEVLRERQVA